MKSLEMWKGFKTTIEKWLATTINIERNAINIVVLGYGGGCVGRRTE